MTAHPNGVLAAEEAIDAPSRHAIVQSDANAMLQAVGTLLGAETADLVGLRGKDRSIEIAAEWARDDCPSSSRRHTLAATVMEEAGLSRPRYRSSNEAPSEGTAFVVELARRNGTPFFLVVQFDRKARLREALPTALSLAPILRRSFALETRLQESERKAAAAMAAIDQDKCGVVAVTAEGRPVVMNGAAADLLSQAKVVQLAHGIVRPTHYSDAIRFHAALDSVTRRGAGFRLRRDAMIMLLNGYGRASSLVVSIAPLPVRARGTADEDPIAIIHLFRPVLSVEGLGAVCRLVGLSPTEAKLAGHLYRGHTIAEAASTMRIKIETARSYLKQIFAKTDTHRQADLLALLYQYSSVVRGNHDYSVI